MLLDSPRPAQGDEGCGYHWQQQDREGEAGSDGACLKGCEPAAEQQHPTTPSTIAAAHYHVKAVGLSGYG